MKQKTMSKIGFGFIVSMLMFSPLVVAQGFEDVISTLQDIGVFQFYLPFILVFAILYGLLGKSNIFGQKSGINVIVALAVSGFMMVYTPVGITFSQFLTNFAGNVMIVILTLLAVLIFGAMLRSGKIIPEKLDDVFKGGTLWAVFLLILVVVFGVFVASGGTAIFPGIKISPMQVFSNIGGISTATWTLIILIVGTGLIVWTLGRGKTE